ncbi:MAG: triose-phosphate isomerase [Vicinamibacterales bacterium]
MRTPLVAGNWKMFKTIHEAVAFAKQFRGLVKDVSGVDIVLAPPFTALHAVAEAVRSTNVAVAGQDVHWEREGAFTGEIGAPMLREAGAEYVIVGHSERRQFFGETDETVNRKVRAALAEELTPIVCVGETLEERERGETFAVLDRQLKGALDGLGPASVPSVVIAYEPVWAIGTGRQASPAQAQDAHAHLRSRLTDWAGVAAAAGCRIVYGGSVKPDTVAEIAEGADVDGALVGGASLDVHAFGTIVVRSRKAAV